jgi:hypothetical protein
MAFFCELNGKIENLYGDSEQSKAMRMGDASPTRYVVANKNRRSFASLRMTAQFKSKTGRSKQRL